LQCRLAEWLHDRPANGPRIVAGFRLDPAEEVATGQLLADLRLLLSVQSIIVPPLRQRLGDLPRLATAFFERSKKTGGTGGSGFSPEAFDILRAYPWPGNMREFESALESAAARAKGEMIEPAHLPEAIRATVGRLKSVAASATPSPLARIKLADVLEGVERRLIVQALTKAKGDKTQAADALGLWRETLLRRLRALKISDGDWRGA